MANKLYPPYIEGTLPAFYLFYDASNTAITGADITVPFTENAAVSSTEYKGFVLRLRTASSGSYLFSPIYSTTFSVSDSTVSFHLNATQARQLNEGQYYKVQIAYFTESYDTFNLASGQTLKVIYRTPGYFSTVGVVKCTSKPEVYIKDLVRENVNFFVTDFVGIYDQTECKDLTEKVYSYCFTVYDDNDEIFYTTGEKLHQSMYDTEYNFSIDKVTVNEVETNGKNFAIQYEITTLNGLKISSPRYKLTNENLASPNAVIEILPESNPDEGYINIHFKGALDLRKSYYYLLNEDFLDSERINIPAQKAEAQALAQAQVDALDPEEFETQEEYEAAVAEIQDWLNGEILRIEAQSETTLITDANNMNLQGVISDKLNNEVNKVNYLKNHNIYKRYDPTYQKPGFIYQWNSNIPENMTPKNVESEVRYYPTSDYDNIMNQLELTEEEKAALVAQLPYLVLLNTGRELVKNVTYQYVKDNHIDLRDYRVVEEAPVEAYYYGSYILSRASDADNYTTWYNVGRFRLEEQVPSKFSVRDITVEHGRKYRYALQQTNIWGLVSARIYSDIYECSFEDMYLFDGEKLLKIRYNPEVNTFKTTILEQKTDTIGGKYPYITRNGETYYKEFPIGGLIAQELDTAESFITKNMGTSHRHSTNAIEDKEPENSLRDWHMFSDENIMLEREFKLKVLEWLNDGKPKLFKSPYEGNYIVRLMNNSLSPVKELGRLLHTFTSQAYEIADCNYENLVKYGFINLKPPSDYVGLWRTYLLVDPDLINEEGDIEIGFDAGLETFTAQDMMPGDVMYLYFTDQTAPEEIMIGITGSYTYTTSKDRVITKLVISPNSSVEQTALRNTTGVVHCYYNGVRITAFDAIIGQQLRTIPSKQWIGYSPWLYKLKHKAWFGGNDQGMANYDLQQWEYAQLQNYNFRDYLDDLVTQSRSEDSLSISITYEVNEKFDKYIASFDPGELVDQINATINRGEAYKIQLLNIEQAKFRLREVIPVYVVTENSKGELQQGTWDSSKLFYNEKRDGDVAPSNTFQMLVAMSPYDEPYPIEDLVKIKMIDPFCIFQVYQQNPVDHSWVPISHSSASSYFDAYYNTWLPTYETDFKINYRWKKIVLIDDDAINTQNERHRISTYHDRAYEAYNPELVYYYSENDEPFLFNGYTDYNNSSTAKDSWDTLVSRLSQADKERFIAAYGNVTGGNLARNSLYFYPAEYEKIRDRTIDEKMKKAVSARDAGQEYNEDDIYDFVIHKELFTTIQTSSGTEDQYYYYYIKKPYYSPADPIFHDTQTYYLSTAEGYQEVHITEFEPNVKYYIKKGDKNYITDTYDLFIKSGTENFYLSQGPDLGRGKIKPNTIYWIKDYDINIDLALDREKTYKNLKDVNSIHIGTGIIAELTFQIKVIDFYTEIRNDDTRIAKQYYLSIKKFYDNLMKNYSILQNADYNMQKYLALKNAYDKLLQGTNKTYLRDEDKRIIRLLLQNQYEKELLNLLTLYTYEEINDELSIEEITELTAYKQDYINDEDLKFGFDGYGLLEAYGRTISDELAIVNNKLSTPNLETEKPAIYAELMAKKQQLEYEKRKPDSIALMHTQINSLNAIINSSGVSSTDKAYVKKQKEWLENELDKITYGARLFYVEVDDEQVYYITNNTKIECSTYNIRNNNNIQNQIPDTIYRLEDPYGDEIYYKVNQRFLQKKFQELNPNENIVLNDYMINYLPVYTDASLSLDDSIETSAFVSKQTLMNLGYRISIVEESEEELVSTGLVLLDRDEAAAYKDTERYISLTEKAYDPSSSTSIAFYEDLLLEKLAEEGNRTFEFDGVAKKLDDITAEINGFTDIINRLYEQLESEKTEYAALFENMQSYIDDYNKKVYQRWAFEELETLAKGEALAHSDIIDRYTNYYRTVAKYLQYLLSEVEEKIDEMINKMQKTADAVINASDLIKTDLPKVIRYMSMVNDGEDDQHLDDYLKRVTIAKRGNIVVCLVTMHRALVEIANAFDAEKRRLLHDHYLGPGEDIHTIIERYPEDCANYLFYQSLFCETADVYNEIYGEVVDLATHQIKEAFWAEDSGLLGYLGQLKENYISAYSQYYNLVRASTGDSIYWDAEEFGALSNYYDDLKFINQTNYIATQKATVSVPDAEGENHTIRNIVSYQRSTAHKNSIYWVDSSELATNPIYNSRINGLVDKMTGNQREDFTENIKQLNTYIFRTPLPNFAPPPDPTPSLYRTFAFFPLSETTKQADLSSTYNYNINYFESLTPDEQEQVLKLSKTLIQNMISLIETSNEDTKNEWRKIYESADGTLTRLKLLEERQLILNRAVAEGAEGPNPLAAYELKIKKAQVSLWPSRTPVGVTFTNNNLSRAFLKIPYESKYVNTQIEGFPTIIQYVNYAESLLPVGSLYPDNLKTLGIPETKDDKITFDEESYFAQYLKAFLEERIEEYEILLKEAVALQRLYDAQYTNFSKKFEDYNSLYTEYLTIYGKYDNSDVMDFYKDSLLGNATNSLQNYRNKVREAWWAFLSTLDYNYSLERERGLYAQ